MRRSIWKCCVIKMHLFCCFNFKARGMSFSPWLMPQGEDEYHTNPLFSSLSFTHLTSVRLKRNSCKILFLRKCGCDATPFSRTGSQPAPLTLVGGPPTSQIWVWTLSLRFEATARMTQIDKIFFPLVCDEIKKFRVKSPVLLACLLVLNHHTVWYHQHCELQFTFTKKRRLGIFSVYQYR